MTQRLLGRGERQPSIAEPQAAAEQPRARSGPMIEIAPNDLLVAYLLSVPGDQALRSPRK